MDFVEPILDAEDDVRRRTSEPVGIRGG